MALTLMTPKPIVSGTTANSAAFQLRQNPTNYKLTLAATGTFSSTTIKLQGSMDGSTWFDIANGSLTAAGCVTVECKLPFFRVSVTVGSGSGLAYAVY